MQKLKRLASALVLAVICIMMLPVTAFADTPYVTYTIDGYG